ncbi:MAG: hypothetical protein E6R08_06335 [Nevskiaceae bacterium]|nr:MAG: hypothetical protein E6R08_06335 [Nevskiaceae bacterium]
MRVPKKGDWVEVTHNIGLLKIGNHHRVNTEELPTDEDGDYTGMFTLDVQGCTVVANWDCVKPVLHMEVDPDEPVRAFVAPQRMFARLQPLTEAEQTIQRLHHDESGIPELWGRAHAAALSAVSPTGEFPNGLIDDVQVVMYTRILLGKL